MQIKQIGTDITSNENLIPLLRQSYVAGVVNTRVAGLKPDLPMIRNGNVLDFLGYLWSIIGSVSVGI